MEESERLWWYDKCLSHNERVQAEIESKRRR
jgi:hypothetical protein